MCVQVEEKGEAVPPVESREVEQSDKQTRMIMVQPFHSSPLESEAQDSRSNNGFEDLNELALPASSGEDMQPVRLEPVRLEPVEPVRLEPIKPVRLEPIEPVRLEPIKPVKPVRLEPIEPVRLEPIKPVKPVRLEPLEPVKLAPISQQHPDLGSAKPLTIEVVNSDSVEHMTKEDTPIKPLSGHDETVSTFMPQDEGDSSSKSIPKLTHPETNPLYSKSSHSLVIPPKEHSATSLKRSSKRPSIVSLPSKRKSQGSLESDSHIFGGDVIRRCSSGGKLASCGRAKVSLSRESLRVATLVYATTCRHGHGKKMASWSCSRSQECLKVEKKAAREK